MLSLFPSLFTYSLLAPFFLRLVLGAVMIFFAFKNIQKRQQITVTFGVIQALCGVLLIIGLLTQLAALVLIIIFGLLLVKQITKKAFLSDGVNYNILLFIIALSLLFTGPGLFAFDYLL